MDPFSADGQTWTKSMRTASAGYDSVGTFYFPGQGPTQMDAADKTFDKYPLMICMMMLVVLVVMGISLRSVVTPLRAVCVMLWMLGVTFALSYFTYQKDWFGFLGWDNVHTDRTGTIFWTSPSIAISICVGLGLDYDIFYTERVLEEREKGYDDVEASIRALGHTGNLISTAGVIMIIAFFPLLCCGTPCLNQISFLLTVGVLIDCFLSTKISIPAGIAILKGINFYPGMPAELECGSSDGSEESTAFSNDNGMSQYGTSADSRSAENPL